jgi:hypothetical protein
MKAIREFLPPPSINKFDTGLRFTDILFGFVLKELIIRLQHWPEIDHIVKLHLIVGTVLTLGSWIGYRRSANRSAYEVKFFNLPFFRFITDQLMIFFYFKIAVMTTEGKQASDPSLVRNTIQAVVFVFLLYWIWDLLGIWMTRCKQADRREYKYPKIHEGNRTNTPMDPDWWGFYFSFESFIAFLLLWFLSQSRPTGLSLVVTVLFLIAYRLAKECKNTLIHPA